MSKYIKPKILFLDIETCPIIADVWQLYDQNVGLNQIQQDWSIIAWAAKWRGEKKIHYMDTGDQKNHRDDSKILKPLWVLMDEADIVVGQYSKKFDVPKINARFIINGIKSGHPPSGYRQQDTKQMAKKAFGFTSFKLEYMAKALNLKNQKLVQREFEGHRLWSECLKSNPRAWKEMRKYNPIDLLATEELYEKILAWDSGLNPNVYHKMHDNICVCGSNNFVENGFRYTNSGKFQRYKCKNCGKEWQSKHNEMSQKKRSGMLK